MKRGIAKRIIKRTIHKKFRAELFKNPAAKSKIKYLTDGYINNEKTNYTNVLNRNETSLLFKARNRMLDIKNNYKNKYQDKTCRLCKTSEETQEHIFNTCTITKQERLIIHKNLLFAKGTTTMRDTTKKIHKIMQLIKANS
jgi:hypothetical protein